MELLAERFKNRWERAKAEKTAKPNDTDEEGRLMIQPFDKDAFKQWAKDQICYLQVISFSETHIYEADNELWNR
jgi:hypothetical protein